MTDNSKYYVYMCIECKHDYKKFFKCKRFDSYDEAEHDFKFNYDEFKFNFDKLYKNRKNLPLPTMIPINKFVPNYFHSSIINSYLSKTFFESRIVDKIEN